MNAIQIGGLIFEPGTVNVNGVIVPTRSITFIRAGHLHESLERPMVAAVIMGIAITLAAVFLGFASLAGRELSRETTATPFVEVAISMTLAGGIFIGGIVLAHRETRRSRDSLVVLVTVASGQTFRATFGDPYTLNRAVEEFKDAMRTDPSITYQIAVLNQPTSQQR